VLHTHVKLARRLPAPVLLLLCGLWQSPEARDLTVRLDALTWRDGHIPGSSSTATTSSTRSSTSSSSNSVLSQLSQRVHDYDSM
jgi:hypothetical protein